MKRNYFKRVLLLYFCFYCIDFCCANYQQLTDSLFKEIENCDTDSIKVKCFNELAWINQNKKPDSAIVYANKARVIATNIGFKRGLATSYYRIGQAERLQGKYLQAIETFKKALRIEDEMANLYGIAKIQGQLTLLYNNIGEADKAILAGQTSINIYKEINNRSALANAYDRLAVVYQNQGRLNEALDLIYSGIRLREHSNDSTNLMYSYINLANVFFSLANYNKALEYNHQAKILAIARDDRVRLSNIYNNLSAVYINLKQYNTSIEFSFKSLEIRQKLNLINTFDANYDNLAVCYAELGEYDKAIEYFGKCIKLKEKNSKVEGLPVAYANLGNLYFRQHNHKMALDCYTKGLDKAIATDNKIILLELYNNIYNAHILANELDSAIGFNNKYIALRDSLDNTYRSAAHIKERFQEEQNKNQLLEKDNLINTIKLKKQKNLVVSLVIGMALLLLLFFTLLNRYKLRQRTLLAENNNRIKDQEISKLITDLEQKSVSAMLEGQECERKRIARDLHDRLGSMLSMVKLHFKSVEDDIDAIKEKNRVVYEKANCLLDEACEEVRKISNDLVSGVLNKFGLIPALDELKRKIEGPGRLNMEVLNFGFDENRLDYTIEINLYRIIQELITNILKHSEASEVSLQLIKKDTGINIVMEDNGVGFDITQLKHSKGMGLKNIESRVSSLLGEFVIDSGKGSGTTISIDIPLNERK